MKRLALLLILTAALFAAPSGAFAKDKHKKHHHYRDHSRYYNDRCDDRGSSYRRSYYDDDRCNDRSYYRPSYSYYRPTYYAPARDYYSSGRSYYRSNEECRPVRRSSNVRFVIGF